MFEDKIPIEANGRIRNTVEKITITKDRIKVVDLDKLLDLMVQNYMKYAYLLSPDLDLIFHAFTVY